MKSQHASRSLKATVAACTLALAMPFGAMADDKITSTVAEKPSGVAMTADLLARPVLAGLTVVGGAIWLVGLPFSAIGGNVKQSADQLVVGPAKNTFVRCLGCVEAGRQ